MLPSCVGNAFVEPVPVLVTLITESPMAKLDAERTWNGFPTKMLAEAGDPGVASLDVTVEVVLIRRPSSKAAAVTFTLKVQLAPGDRVAFVRVTRLLPAGAAIVPPPQLPTRPLGLDTSKPVGSVSEKASPVKVNTEFGLVRLNVRLVEPPGTSVRLPKLFARSGDPATVKVATAAGAAGAFVEVRVLLVFSFVPSVVPTTFTEMVQVVPEGAFTVPPVKPMLFDPAVALAVPPQVLTKPLGVATTTPAGMVSVKVRPVTAAPPLFLIVKVSVDAPPMLMLAGENAFEKLRPGPGWKAATVCVPPSITVALPAVKVVASVLITRTAEVAPGGILVPGGAGMKLNPTVLPEASRSAVTGKTPAVPLTKLLPVRDAPSKRNATAV